jgi:Deoxynucleotide monophosphate kinase
MGASLAVHVHEQPRARRPALHALRESAGRTMIVGLTGNKQHGKDTVGSILVNDHGFVRVSFADALKQSAAALFDVPVETWDEYKNDEHAYVELFAGHHARFTVREFLQRFGTEAHRDIFGGTFWTDFAEDKIVTTIDAGTPVVVTDVRFDEEADLVRRHGGVVVQVYRPQVVDSQAVGHSSEQLPTADWTLFNGGTIDDLRKAIAFDVLGRGEPDGLAPAYYRRVSEGGRP